MISCKNGARPRLVQLESRWNPATYMVKDLRWDATIADTLPWAVGQANGNAGHDIIDFDFTVLPAAANFTSTGTLTITEGVTIIGHGGLDGGPLVTISGDRPFLFDHGVPVQETDSYVSGIDFVQCSASSLADKEGGGRQGVRGRGGVRLLLFRGV